MRHLAHKTSLPSEIWGRITVSCCQLRPRHLLPRLGRAARAFLFTLHSCYKQPCNADDVIRPFTEQPTIHSLGHSTKKRSNTSSSCSSHRPWGERGSSLAGPASYRMRRTSMEECRHPTRLSICASWLCISRPNASNLCVCSMCPVPSVNTASLGQRARSRSRYSDFRLICPHRKPEACAMLETHSYGMSRVDTLCCLTTNVIVIEARMNRP